HRGLRAKDTEPLESIPQGAATLARSLHGVPEAHTIAAVLRAGLYTRAGDRAHTLAELAIIEQSLSYVLGDGTFCYLSVEAAAFAGSEALRRALLRRIEGFSNREVPSGHVPVTYEGSAIRMLALLDAALGNEERAEVRFREALARAKLHDLGPWI